MSVRHDKVTGYSGNEIFCLDLLKLDPGRLCLGNDVLAMGLRKSIGSGLANLAGGEIEEITNLVRDGRRHAYERMLAEAKESGGAGLAGITLDVVMHAGNLEFIATGSVLHARDGQAAPYFTAAADGQGLYCQLDAGFTPRGFVFGNVAYSIGVGGNIGGGVNTLRRGEVAQYSQIFDATRHRALARVKDEAKAVGANAVLGIRTSVLGMLGAQEMMMTGTAASHPALAAHDDDPVTSDLRDEELWNMTHLGYMPVELVMGVSVYSLGVVSGIGAFFKSFAGGRIDALTELLYEAREKAFDRIHADAERCGADRIVGVKTRIYDLGGGLVEFMVIGTAVRKTPGARTLHDALPAQAVITDQETLVETLDPTAASAQVTRTVGGGTSFPSIPKAVGSLLGTFAMVAIYILLQMLLNAHPRHYN